MTAISADRPLQEKSGVAALGPGTKVYDLLFGMPLIAWYGMFLFVQAPLILHEISELASSTRDPLLLLDVLSKTSAFLFAALLIGLVVIRKPAARAARGFTPKAVAFLGAFLSVAILGLRRQEIGWPLEILSTALVLGGMSFALYGLTFLGRSFSVLSEARTLVTGGPYSFVRHPLYLGEETALIGVTLQFISPLAIGFLAMQFGFQLYRMSFEEHVMQEEFPEYADYAKRVKRLIPGVY